MEEKRSSLDDTYPTRTRYQQRISENEASNRRRDYRQQEGRVDGSYRKRARHDEARTYARPRNSDRREDEPSPKRVQHSRSSPRDPVKSDSRYDNRHRGTPAYPYASSDRRIRKDAFDNKRYSQFGSECSKHPQTSGEKSRGHLHVRDRSKQSMHMNRDWNSSSEDNFTRERAREREKRNHHRDRSPRSSTRQQKLQLPVDGATSSRQRHGVVPYAGSEASSPREQNSATKKKRNESLMKVLSMVDCGFVPSLPDKYYSTENDQVVLNTGVTLFHISITINLLAV